MNIQISYPKTNSSKFILSKIRRISLIVLISSAVIVGIINLALQGTPWCLYVFGGEVVLWMMFLSWPQVERSFMEKTTETIIAVCLFLLVCDFVIDDLMLLKTVVPILIFSLIIIQHIIYFFTRKTTTRNFLPLMWTTSFSLIVVLLSIVRVIFINWQMITLGSVALASAIVSVSFYLKPISLELKKRFHI